MLITVLTGFDRRTMAHISKIMTRPSPEAFTSLVSEDFWFEYQFKFVTHCKSSQPATSLPTTHLLNFKLQLLPARIQPDLCRFRHRP